MLGPQDIYPEGSSEGRGKIHDIDYHLAVEALRHTSSGHPTSCDSLFLLVERQTRKTLKKNVRPSMKIKCRTVEKSTDVARLDSTYHTQELDGRYTTQHIASRNE